MVELIINGNKIELPKKTNIKFTKQISDIFDVSNVSCSFTNSFEFDKTPVNTQAMRQLGISSDGSDIPYIKNSARLKFNGFDVVSDGWYNVSGTDSNYKGSILDGMIDFFKAIENKTMGKDLNLSNFNHEKLLSTVVASFTNSYYRYIIADYGGKNIFESGINIDYLAPCFSYKKLWELIFSTFGFNCDYTNLTYLDGLYLTYPKDVAEGQTDELIATLHKGPFTTQDYKAFAGMDEPAQQYSWTTSVISEGYLTNNWKFVIPEYTSYSFDLKVENYVTYRKPNKANRITNPSVSIYKNGIAIGNITSDYVTDVQGIGDERTLNFNITCDKGDIIEIRIYSPSNLSINGHSYRNYVWNNKKVDLLIYKTNLGTTSLQNELKDFSIKDFIKEIIWRTGLTPILDKQTNTVNFITLNSRIDFGNAKDLSKNFIGRTSEIYSNDYAQKNIFKLKRNEDTDNSGDGFLYVYNRNIDDEKVIASSKIYAPDLKILTNFIGFSTNQYKIWNAEAKDNNGVIEISYKGLSGRFYLIRQETKTGSFKIISEKLEDETTVSSVPIAVNTDTLFEDAVYKNYSEYQKIFTNFRIHTISLALTENEFIGLDLTKPVFFKQENAYYICNKITFQEGEVSVGEFIKINKV